MASSFAERLEDVRDRIARAAERSARTADAVTLIAVSKTHPASAVAEALAAGVTDFGENRVQEGESKATEVPRATWHLIGPLQSNKARRSLKTFAVIETVGSVELATRLDAVLRQDEQVEPYPVLLQVNVRYKTRVALRFTGIPE